MTPATPMKDLVEQLVIVLEDLQKQYKDAEEYPAASIRVEIAGALQIGTELMFKSEEQLLTDKPWPRIFLMKTSSIYKMIGKPVPELVAEYLTKL